MTQHDEKLRQAHKRFGDDHAAQRAALLAALPAPTQRSKSRIRPLALIAAVTVVSLLSWTVWDSMSQRSVGWAAVAGQIREIRSVSYRLSHENDAGVVDSENQYTKAYYRSTGQARSDSFERYSPNGELARTGTWITVAHDESGVFSLELQLMNEPPTISVSRLVPSNPGRSRTVADWWNRMIQLDPSFVTFEGHESDDGKALDRYRARVEESLHPVLLTIWVDPGTSLPCRVRAESVKPGAFRAAIIDEFSYNELIPDSLFSITAAIGNKQVEEQWHLPAATGPAPGPRVQLTCDSHQLEIEPSEWTTAVPGVCYLNAIARERLVAFSKATATAKAIRVQIDGRPAFVQPVLGPIGGLYCTKK